MDEEQDKNPVILGEDGELRLSGAWTVEYATSLRELLLKRIGSQRPTAVDLSGIEWLDTAGLQLLLALTPLLKEGARVFGANQDVRRALQVSGVASVLEAHGVTVDFNSEA